MPSRKLIPPSPEPPASERPFWWLLRWPSWCATSSQRYRFLLVAGMFLLLVKVLIMAHQALVPFFLGLVLAYMILPVVNLLDRHAPPFLKKVRLARPLAIIVVYIILLGLVAGTLSSFIPAVVSQGQTFVTTVPEYFSKIQGTLTTDIAALLNRVPPEIQTSIDSYLAEAGKTILTAVQKGLVVTISTVSNTISFILGMVIIPIWLFYVLNDSDKVRASFYNLIPARAREDVRSIITVVDELLSSYIRGQLLLSLVLGVMATIVLLAFRVDLALLLGTLVGLFEIVPILGPYLGAIPALLVAFLNRPILALWVGLCFVGIQQIEHIFLVPRIAGRAVRFHPAVVMVIVVIGSEVAGLWGLLLAVPVAAVVRDIFQYLYLRTTERGDTPAKALKTMHASNSRWT